MRAPHLIGLTFILCPLAVGCGADDESVDVDEETGIDESAEVQGHGHHGHGNGHGHNNNPKPLDVDFVDCVESIGVGLVPTALAQELTPEGFILVGGADPVTPLVVRTAHCDKIKIKNKTSRDKTIVQIGAVIVPPDGTGDINNYTYWYFTDDETLADKLQDAGVQAEDVCNIGFSYNRHQTSNNFRVRVYGDPYIDIRGTVTPSVVPVGSFDANWWQTSFDDGVKMATNVPNISIGSANLTLTTNPNSDVADLIGGTTLGFPIIQQFNTFPNAHMHVDVVD